MKTENGNFRFHRFCFQACNSRTGDLFDRAANRVFSHLVRFTLGLKI